VMSRPACSILPPKYPPMAPAPTTSTRILLSRSPQLLSSCPALCRPSTSFLVWVPWRRGWPG